MYTKKKTSNRQANFEIDTYLQLEQVGFVQMIAGNAKQQGIEKKLGATELEMMKTIGK